MDSSQPIFDAPACGFTALLGAYHDRELPQDQAVEVRRHLLDCPSCRATLQDIAELSSLASGLVIDELSERAIRGIHRSIDADREYPVVRIAGVLTGLAASALVIGGVWLSEIPASGGGGRSATPVVVIPQSASWEPMAVNLSAAPLPDGRNDLQSQQMMADADTRATRWTLSALAGRSK